MTKILDGVGHDDVADILELAVALDQVPLWRTLGKFGRNPDVDTAAPEDVWLGGGLYTGLPTGAPEIMEVFSDNAADTGAGTGAQTIRISGLQTSDSETYETEDLTLNGVTPVDSVNSWYRVNRVQVLTAGSGGSNTGVITVRHKVTTANVFAAVAAGAGQTAIAAYTVPANRQILLTGIYIQVSRAAGPLHRCF